MKKFIQLIMFDLDGTLADTGHDLAESVNFTRAHFHLSPLRDKLVYANVGRGVEHLLRRSLPEEGPENFPEVMKVFLAHYEKHLLDRTVLYPGVHEVLKHFRSKRRLVVSNKIHRLTLAVVRGLGVAEEFDDILGGDSAAQKKPDPALLQLALEKFQVPAATALMVGDGDIDVEAGKRAGVVTCGVTYGLANRDELVVAKPDFLIDNLSELVNFFC